MSMRCSRANRRTAGDAPRSAPSNSSSDGAATTGAGEPLGEGGEGCAACGAGPAGAAEAAGTAALAAPTSSITAIGVPVATVSPSLTSNSRIVPVTGDGTPALTLSVETSTKSSYLSTESPTLLSHWATVPSVTVSPSCGIVIVVAMLELHHRAHCLSHFRGRRHELFLERHRVAHGGHVGAA